MTAQYTLSPLYVENTFGDSYLECINQDAFKNRHASTLYAQKYGATLFHEDTIYIVVGSDSNVLSHYIEEHGIPSGSRYLFVEPSPVFDLIETDTHNENIIFAREEDWLNTAREAGIASYSYKGNVNFLYSMAAGHQPHDVYKSLNATLEDAVKHLLWKYTTQFDLQAHNKQILENICENQIPASKLRGLFKGKTAVIMGAGPSLDIFIPWIKENREKIILLGVSRLANSLIDHNITPDIIVTVDPQTVSYVISQAILKLNDRCLLANSASAANQLVSQWPGQSVYLNNHLPWNADVNIDNIQACAPTVTNTAFNIAIAMGAQQIILAGIDLCYSPEGYSHASGNAERDKGGAFTAAAEHTVETNSGQLAETNRGYYAAIEAFAEQSDVAVKLGCNVINPAADAAKIDHIRYEPIEDIVITEPLTTPAFQTIQKNIAANTSQTRLTHYQNASQEIDDKILELKVMATLVNEAITYNHKLLNKNGQEISPKFKAKIDKIERKLQNKHKILDSLIKMVFGSEFAKTINTKENHEITINNVIEQGDFYYSTYKTGIAEYILLLEHCLSRLSDRILEEKTPPPIEKIAARWRNDLQLGRASVWKKHHQEAFAKLSAHEQQTIELLIEEQQKTLEAERRGYFDFVDSTPNQAITLGKLLERIVTMFGQQDSDGLQRLLTGLQLRTDNSSEQITILSQGYLAELKQEFATALNHYDKLSAKKEWVTKQNGLERILEISIEQEDFDRALLALKELREHVESYTPFYIQLLEVTGKLEEAARLYDEQLKTDPNNVETLEQYALFLVRNHAIDGAQALLDAIKKIPNTETLVSVITEALVQHSDQSSIG